MSEAREFGGRYQAERTLGQGGFGVVLAASDRQTGRQVALKVLRGTELDGEARDRFGREARVVQRLTHPNTVRLYDFGAETDGTQYIVYELLEGETLTQLLKRGPVPWERVVRIGVQVLKSLSEAHGLGIVHRDVKPANVMLVQFAGDADVVKLLDFGIAKPLMGASRALTQTGIMLGTPRFMSPEQISGAEVTARSDLYSLGLTLIELVSGRRVFDGDPFDIMLKQVSPDPVPIPAEVRNAPYGSMLARAVEKDPNRRFQSALEMLAALENTLQATQASLAPPTPPTILMHAPPERSGAGLVIGIAVGMVVVMGLGVVALVGVWFFAISPPPPVPTVIPAPPPPSASSAPAAGPVSPPAVSSSPPKPSAQTPSPPKPTPKPKTRPSGPPDFGY